MISRSLFVESKKLRIFDFDDTLVRTKSHVYVTHKNGTETKLKTGEYATHKLKKGDEYDYRDLDTVKDPLELKRMTSILRRIMKSSKGSGVYILTARGKYKPIKQYLKDIGIKRDIYVVALASNDPKDKSDWIENMIDTEDYDDVYFADDNEMNVKSVKKMLRKKNVKWRVQHIKH